MSSGLQAQWDAPLRDITPGLRKDGTIGWSSGFKRFTENFRDAAFYFGLRAFKQRNDEE